MCGRYALSANVDDLIEEFDVVLDATATTSASLLKSPQQPPAGQPDYNIAPTKQAPIVLTRAVKDDPPVRQLRLLTWGLVPSWSSTSKGAVRMINARAETLLQSRAFAKAALARRCLVPMTAWYEWRTEVEGGPKQPYAFRSPGGQDLGVAGVYEFWRDKDVANRDDPSAWLTTFSIVTTAAASELAVIHDRQPLVIPRQAWTDWLDPQLTQPDAVAEMLSSPPGARPEIVAYPVGTAVSNSRSNGAALLDPDTHKEALARPADGGIIAE